MKSVALIILILFSFEVKARCKAILINGGGNPANNFNIHTAQLREMYNALRAQGCKEEDMHVFSASGKTDSPDFRMNPVSEDSRYVSNPYQFNGATRVPNLYASDTTSLKTQISKISKTFGEDDKVFIYVSDHGNDVNGKKGIVPWWKNGDKSEVFTPDDLEQALAATPEKTKIKMWTECCFCGVFNKIKRANTCVATSTDEHHAGSYNWTNWNLYQAMGDSAAYTLSSKTYFAGQLKKSPASTSLNTAARVSRNLTAQDAEIQNQTMIKGCMVGPRDSLEQYAFSVLGFADKQICIDDLLRLSNENVKSQPKEQVCDKTSCFNEIDKLSAHLDAYAASDVKLNYADNKRITELKKQLKTASDAYKNSPQFKEIERLKAHYAKLGADKKIKTAAEYQRKVQRLKAEALKHSEYLKLVGDQKLVVEALFFSRATPVQKAEYRRRKSCLDEPLVQ